jgi:hypothetical protein
MCLFPLRQVIYIFICPEMIQSVFLFSAHEDEDNINPSGFFSSREGYFNKIVNFYKTLINICGIEKRESIDGLSEFSSLICRSTKDYFKKVSEFYKTSPKIFEIKKSEFKSWFIEIFKVDCFPREEAYLKKIVIFYKTRLNRRTLASDQLKTPNSKKSTKPAIDSYPSTLKP